MELNSLKYVESEIAKEVERRPRVAVRAAPRPEMTVTSTQQARWPSPPDPGDLSKRVAHRRTELRLSRQQVAARSGMSARYLEYLERYPARPGPDTLRHLAAALRTTPAVLLGAGADTPPGQVKLASP